MRSTLLRTCAFGVLSLLAGPVLAFNGVPSPMVVPHGTSGPEAAIANDPYTALTSLGTATNNFVLIEDTTTPTADDRVTFNAAPELINNSFGQNGSLLPTVVRTVTEADVAGPAAGTRTMSVTVTGTGDLWPTGYAAGTPPVALTRGGFGFGIVLPASINGGVGGEGLAWDGAVINNITMDFVDITGPTNGVAIPNNFYNTVTGAFGVIFSDAGSPTGVTGFETTLIRVNVNYTPVPEPVSIAMLLPLAGMMLRRRSSI